MENGRFWLEHWETSTISTPIFSSILHWTIESIASEVSCYKNKNTTNSSTKPLADSGFPNPQTSSSKIDALAPTFGGGSEMAPGLPKKTVQLWAPKFKHHPQQTQGSVVMKGSSARLASFGADRQAEKL